jgi:hypothetical protein
MSDLQPLEIFRPGTHVSMSGNVIAFSDADLAACAAAYDPAKHEAPIVIGHPVHDAPAYGWVKRLEFREGALFALPHQVEPSFAEAVNAGRYKKISPAFYAKGSRTSPAPDSLYLRHIGTLGAMPPAVKGMRDAAFVENDLDFLSFGDFSVLEDALRQKDAELRRERATYRLNELLKTGKALPRERERIFAFVEAMGGNDSATLEFSEGGAVQKMTVVDFLFDLLEKRPPLVCFGEIAAPRDLTAQNGTPAGVKIPKGWGADGDGMETLSRIQDHMRENRCDYTTAMLAVCGG